MYSSQLWIAIAIQRMCNSNRCAFAFSCYALTYSSYSFDAYISYISCSHNQHTLYRQAPSYVIHYTTTREISFTCTQWLVCLFDENASWTIFTIVCCNPFEMCISCGLKTVDWHSSVFSYSLRINILIERHWS